MHYPRRRDSVSSTASTQRVTVPESGYDSSSSSESIHALRRITPPEQRKKIPPGGASNREDDDIFKFNSFENIRATMKRVVPRAANTANRGVNNVLETYLQRRKMREEVETESGISDSLSKLLNQDKLTWEERYKDRIAAMEGDGGGYTLYEYRKVLCPRQYLGVFDDQPSRHIRSQGDLVCSRGFQQDKYQKSAQMDLAPFYIQAMLCFPGLLREVRSTFLFQFFLCTWVLKDAVSLTVFSTSKVFYKNQISRVASLSRDFLFVCKSFGKYPLYLILKSCTNFSVYFLIIFLNQNILCALGFSERNSSKYFHFN